MERQPDAHSEDDKELLDLARRADRDASFWACNYGRASWLAELLARVIRTVFRRRSPPRD